MARKQSAAVQAAQRSLEEKSKRSQQLTALRNIRMGDALSRYLLILLDNVIGSNFQCKRMTMQQLQELSEIGKTALYQRIKQFEDAGILIVTHVEGTHQKDFSLCWPNILAIADGEDCFPPDGKAVRHTESVSATRKGCSPRGKTVRHAENDQINSGNSNELSATHDIHNQHDKHNYPYGPGRPDGFLDLREEDFSDPEAIQKAWELTLRTQLNWAPSEFHRLRFFAWAAHVARQWGKIKTGFFVLKVQEGPQAVAMQIDDEHDMEAARKMLKQLEAKTDAFPDAAEHQSTNEFVRRVKRSQPAHEVSGDREQEFIRHREEQQARLMREFS